MFEFSEAEKMLQEEVRSFAREELLPGSKDRAKNPAVPREIWKKIADLGYTGMGLPEKYGGRKASWVERGIVLEEVSKVDVNMGVLIHHVQNMADIILKGSEEAADEWVPSLIRTDKICCAGITEPDCGSDVSAIRTEAIKKEDSYTINGEKTSVTRGTYADICLVFAKTDPTAGVKGLTQFLVPLDLPGIAISSFEDMGCIPMGRASVHLDEVIVPEKYCLGGEGQALSKQFASAIGQGRAMGGLSAIAAAQATLDETIAFVKERTAFGVPIVKNEGVSFKIAEAATYLTAARWLCYYALSLADKGLPSLKEGSMCKWWGPQLAVEIIHDCILLNGHIGYSEDLPIEQRLRDVIGAEFADGTAEINKLNIAREIIGKIALPYK